MQAKTTSDDKLVHQLIRNGQIHARLAQAGLRRADALRANADLSDKTRAFWDGYAKAMNELVDGTLFLLAMKDAAALNDVQAGPQGTGAGLTVGVDVLRTGLVVETYATQGVQVAADTVANGEINTTEQLKNSELTPVVNAQDKHSPDGMNVGNGTNHE